MTELSPERARDAPEVLRAREALCEHYGIQVGDASNAIGRKES